MGEVIRLLRIGIPAMDVSPGVANTAYLKRVCSSQYNNCVPTFQIDESPQTPTLKAYAYSSLDANNPKWCAYVTTSSYRRLSTLPVLSHSASRLFFFKSQVIGSALVSIVSGLRYAPVLVAHNGKEILPYQIHRSAPDPTAWTLRLSQQ